MCCGYDDTALLVEEQGCEVQVLGVDFGRCAFGHVELEFHFNGFTQFSGGQQSIGAGGVRDVASHMVHGVIRPVVAGSVGLGALGIVKHFLRPAQTVHEEGIVKLARVSVVGGSEIVELLHTLDAVLGNHISQTVSVGFGVDGKVELHLTGNGRTRHALFVGTFKFHVGFANQIGHGPGQFGGIEHVFDGFAVNHGRGETVGVGFDYRLVSFGCEGILAELLFESGVSGNRDGVVAAGGHDILQAEDAVRTPAAGVGGELFNNGHTAVAFVEGVNVTLNHIVVIVGHFVVHAIHLGYGEVSDVCAGLVGEHCGNL